MEQRTYQGDVAPEGLADYLVQYYNAQEHLRAQKLGQGDALVVQIGRPHDQELRHAVTLGIHRAPGEESGLVVTMGEQQWFTPEMATSAVVMGLISILVTPWALFALLWPVSAMLGSRVLPSDIWHTVETFVMSQGAIPAAQQVLAHPHLGSTPPPYPGTAQAFTQPAPATPPAPESRDDAETQRLDNPRLR